MALEINDSNFEEIIGQETPVVVDFWAEWCGPCIKLGSAVEAIADKYDGKAVVGKMNIDENDEVSSEYRVRIIPTILFFKDGELKDRSVGLVPQADLEAKLEALL